MIPQQINCLRTQDDSMEGQTILSEASRSIKTLEDSERQREIYASSVKEEMDTGTKNTIQRYLKKVYRQIKFLSDNRAAFTEPDFVQMKRRGFDGIMRESQTVQICDWILENIGMIVLFCVRMFLILCF